MQEYNQVTFSRRLLTRFIEMYKGERCLWDRHCVEYKMKAKKHASLAKLTQLVKEYDDYATRVHVLRKIDSIRACVRREHKRVVESRLNGGEVYTPTLWYYDMLSFLFEFDEDSAPAPVQNVNTYETEEDEDAPSEEDHTASNEDSYSADYNTISVAEVEVNDGAGSSKKHRASDEGTPKSKRVKASTEVEDEYDAIGVNVAAKLRYLPSNMRILAEKLINDVLFQAQTNGLNSSTKIVTSDPFT